MAKNELNSPTFFLKSVIYLLFSNSSGIFLPIGKLFKMDQLVLERLLMSDNLLVIRE